jgi:hypothetical protein
MHRIFNSGEKNERLGKLSAIFLTSLLFQGFSLYVGGNPIRPYMFLVVLFVPWMLGNFARRFYRYELVMGLLFALLVASSFVAIDPALAVRRALGIVILVVAYGLLTKDRRLLVKIYSSRWCQFIILAYFVVSLLYYLYGLYVFSNTGYVAVDVDDRGIYGLYLEGVLPRMRGFTDSPNNLVILCLCSFWLNELSPFKGYRRLNNAVVVLVLLCTLSITGYVAAFLYAIYKLPKWGVAAVLALVLVAGVGFSISQGDTEQMYEERVSRIETGSGRWEIFEFIGDRIRENPLGYGLAQARVVLETFHIEGYQSSHNNLLEVALEGGVLAAVLYLAASFSLLAHIYQSHLLSREIRRIALLWFAQLFVLGMSNLMIYVEIYILAFALLYLFVRGAEDGELELRSDEARA